MIHINVEHDCIKISIDDESQGISDSETYNVEQVESLILRLQYAIKEFKNTKVKWLENQIREKTLQLKTLKDKLHDETVNSHTKSELKQDELKQDELKQDECRDTIIGQTKHYTEVPTDEQCTKAVNSR